MINGSDIIQHQMIKKMWQALILTGFIFIIEVGGGILANSLALLSDAGHLFADLMAIGFSLAALYLANLPANPRKTFGYHRVEILAAILNGLSLLVVSVFIFREAYQRLGAPEEVKSFPLLVVAVFGLVVNLLVLLLLDPVARHNLNVRSAFLHVVGDMLSSVGVIAGAVIIALTGNRLVDPIISILIGFIILRGAYGVLRDAVHILLEGSPTGIDSQAVAAEILATPGVTAISDLHIWTLSSRNNILTANLTISGDSPHLGRKILDQLKTVLAEKYGIRHTTLQLECECCRKSGESADPTGKNGRPPADDTRCNLQNNILPWNNTSF